MSQVFIHQVSENKPSEEFVSLSALSRSELEGVFRRGAIPDFSMLAGWEFRGLNHPSWAKLVGIRKFIKGFYWRNEDQPFGYNCPVQQNADDQPWLHKENEDKPKRFGFYRVSKVDARERDNEYLRSLLLNYGEGENPRLDPTRNLRDYLVQVDAENPNLFLGKAYYAVLSRRIPTNFFLLERHREAPSAVAH